MTPQRAIQVALAFLEAGDRRGAELILLNALDNVQPVRREWRCEPGCGRGFEWPGLLDAHRFNCVHAIEAAA